MAADSDAEIRWGSVQSYSRRWSISERTVYRWISEGRLPTKRIGQRLIRVDLDHPGRAHDPDYPESEARLAINDPVALAKAARILRAAMARPDSAESAPAATTSGGDDGDA